MLRMNRWMAVAALGLLAAGFQSPARADDAPSATGNWSWEFKRQNGDAVQIMMKLKQDGEKLTGTMTGPGGNEIEIKDGSVKNGTVSFNIIRERDGNTFTIKYEGKLSGDTIKGQTKFERDGETQTREWEAKRS